MHEINNQFKAITDILSSIKQYDLEIDLKDLLDFYKEYQFHKNLVIDAINAQIIQYDGSAIPFSEEEIAYMIDVFIMYNNYDYDRLICESLFVLNDAQAYRYLSKILNTDEKRTKFKSEFQHWDHFKKVKDELGKIGNII